jgi:uncharacterized protein
VHFEWDLKKEQANVRKHGISFARARQLLESDADYLEIFDEAHSVDEDRFIAIGPIDEGVIQSDSTGSTSRQPDERHS